MQEDGATAKGVETTSPDDTKAKTAGRPVGYRVASPLSLTEFTFLNSRLPCRADGRRKHLCQGMVKAATSLPLVRSEP